MCSVLLLQGVLADAPLAVFFVRDEELDRGGTSPTLRPDAPGVLAPRDPRAGGTWFGVAAGGFLGGLVNRKGDPEPEEGISRGRLMLDVLGADSLDAAVERAAQLVRDQAYGGCRLFLGDGQRLCWLDLPVSGHPSPPHELGQGSWLMRHTRHPQPAPEALVPQDGETAAAWLDRVGALVADHQPSGDPLCVHGDEHGSVDTTFAALDADGRPALFLHAQGAPCQGSLLDCGDLLQELTGAA